MQGTTFSSHCASGRYNNSTGLDTLFAVDSFRDYFFISGAGYILAWKMDIYILPHLQAVFNATTACLLTAGYILIRKKNKTAHKACMLTAVMVAVLCTVSYLTFHFTAGTVKFQGTGMIRPIYFLILGSHSVLAVATLPLVILALSRAFKEKFDRHKKIARLTFPVWLYVSITGVVFYFMHYHLYPNVSVP